MASPAGAARELLGEDGPPAEAALLQARLARREAGRLRMLAPVREHAARRELSGAGLAALRAYGFAIARDLVRHANGDRQLDFAALARDLGNVESILALPDPPATAHDLGRWSLALGDAYSTLGRLGAAEAAGRRGKDILAAYAAHHPDDHDARRLLAVAWERLGDLRVAVDDRRGAAAAFLEHRRLIGDLLRTEPADPAWQRDLVVSLDKLGEVLLAAGDQAAALAICTERLERCRQLAAHDPDSALHQRDLAAGWDKLGNVHWAGDDFARARDAYLAAKAIRASLHARDPADPQLCRALSVSWENIAWCLELTGDAAAALAAWRTALALSEPLAQAHPDIADYRTTPAEQLEQLARTLAATGATTEPLALLDRALALLQPLAETDPPRRPRPAPARLDPGAPGRRSWSGSSERPDAARLASVRRLRLDRSGQPARNTPHAAAGPVRAFLSYAHEDHAWRDRVLEQLGWLRQQRPAAGVRRPPDQARGAVGPAHPSRARGRRRSSSS